MARTNHPKSKTYKAKAMTKQPKPVHQLSIPELDAELRDLKEDFFAGLNDLQEVFNQTMENAMSRAYAKLSVKHQRTASEFPPKKKPRRIIYDEEQETIDLVNVDV